MSATFGCVRSVVALVDRCCCCGCALRHGTSSDGRWFRTAACRKRSSYSCNHRVRNRLCWCARYCTSIHRVRRGCHAPKSKSSSTSRSSAGTSTDRRTSCSSPSEPSSSTSTMNRHGEALWWWTVWNSEGSSRCRTKSLDGCSGNRSGGWCSSRFRRPFCDSVRGAVLGMWSRRRLIVHCHWELEAGRGFKVGFTHARTRFHTLNGAEKFWSCS